MSQRTNFQTHFKKKSSYELSKTLFNYDNNSIIIDNTNNKPNLNSNRIRTPYHEENKYNFIKRESSPLEQIQHDRYRKYTSYTHHPFATINNRRNNEENSKNDNLSSIYYHGIKNNTKENYILSDDNILKFTNKEKQQPYISQNNRRSDKRSSQLSLDFNSKNNNNINNNKFFINEEFNNKTANNLQTKTTRVLRIKNVQNNNNNNRLDESNKRLKSVEPQKRNANTIFYSSHITHKNETKKDSRQNSYI